MRDRHELGNAGCTTTTFELKKKRSCVSFRDGCISSIHMLQRHVPRDIAGTERHTACLILQALSLTLRIPAIRPEYT